MLFCLAASGGMLLWNTVTDDEMLWTPYGSDFVDSKRWIDEKFPPDIRYEILIYTAPNVLTPENIKFVSVSSHAKNYTDV